MTSIGIWDFKRTRSHIDMKEGNLQGETFFGIGTKEKEFKFLVICCSFIFVGVVCISVVDRLQYMVAREKIMPKGVNGYIYEG